MNAAHPSADWQFWIVTLLAVGSAIMIVRSLIPSTWWPSWLRRRLRRSGARTTLTVSARRKPEN